MARQSSGTIQGVIDLGHRLTAWCQNPQCGHRADLDMLALRDRFGPDHGAMYNDLVPKLVCSKCGGTQVGLTVTTGEKQRGSNPYEQAKGGR